jgi:predicted nucleic acid-binding protein
MLADLADPAASPVNRTRSAALRRHLKEPGRLIALTPLGTRAMRERMLAEGREAEQMLADYPRLRITRHPLWPYHPRMWELRHYLGAYDAAYIALAEALVCELLTGDVKLKNAAGHHATVIVTR